MCDELGESRNEEIVENQIHSQSKKYKKMSENNQGVGRGTNKENMRV